MKPIENANLDEIYITAANLLIEERRAHAIEQTMELLRRSAALSADVRNTENKLNNQKTELDKLKSKIDLLRKGDWNLLSEYENKSGKSGKNTENKE